MSNVFVIAPDHADLPDVSREIAAIARCHTAEVLRGPVRDLDISAKLLELEETGFIIDIIWWITHGGRDGVLLSDGLLDTQGAGQYVRKSGADLCVFNTCDSEEVALSIVAGSEADMIYTVGGIRNRVAVRFGVLLASELAQTEDYRTAYKVIAPQDGAYRFLAAKAQYRRYNYTSEFEQPAPADRIRIQVMLIGVYVLIVIASIGLYREIVTIQENQTRIIQDMREIEQRVIQVQMDRPAPNYTPLAPYSSDNH